MTNKMQPAEIAERLKIIRNEMFFNHAEDYIAFDSAAEIVRNHVDIVHAEWIKQKCQGDYGLCSKCNCRIPWIPKNFKYCPRCGAKMDGERKDGVEK